MARDDGHGHRPGHGRPARSTFGDAGEAVLERGHLVVRWLLIEGNRDLLTLLLSLAVLASLVVVGSVWPFEMQRLVTETRAVQTLFNTLLGGIILLVSIVVSINSVVLTQEVTSLGTQYRRIEDSVEFRQDLEDLVGEGVSPVYPNEFLDFILGSLREEARRLRGLLGDVPDPTARDRVETYLDDIERQTDGLADRLDRAAGRPKEVLFIGLEYEYSWQIYAARRLKHEHGDALAEAESEALDELVRLLQFFATGREYFKTLYIKGELARLSKTILYVSLPAIVFTSYVLLAIDAGLFPSFSLPGVPPLLLFVALAFVVGLSPFLLLTAYVVRIAAVSERSLAAGPFLLGRQDGRTEIDWE